jgi:8-amino-7-oxononanoate synthase
MQTNSTHFLAEEGFAKKLQARTMSGLFRRTHPFPVQDGNDFISNDYLSLGRESVFQDPGLIKQMESIQGGSGSSRLVSGESPEIVALEEKGAFFFDAEATLFFPSGYLANIGLLSTAGGRGDTYLYDVQCHMSIKEGMRLSLADRYAFKHQDIEDLVRLIKKARGNVFVITEAIYSMDGDVCKLEEILAVCEEYGAQLILDEAHSTGVLGPGGRGLGCHKDLGKKIFARILTFGKALGAAGALIACSKLTQSYLINFCPAFIYSTGPLPVQSALCSYQLDRLIAHPEWPEELQKIIQIWLEAPGQAISKNNYSPVQYIMAGNSQKAIQWMEDLKKQGFLTKAMVSPTVPESKERLRITLHRHNTEASIIELARCFSENRNFF